MEEDGLVNELVAEESSSSVDSGSVHELVAEESSSSSLPVSVNQTAEEHGLSSTLDTAFVNALEEVECSSSPLDSASAPPDDDSCVPDGCVPDDADTTCSCDSSCVSAVESVPTAPTVASTVEDSTFDLEEPVLVTELSTAEFPDDARFNDYFAASGYVDLEALEEEQEVLEQQELLESFPMDISELHDVLKTETVLPPARPSGRGSRCWDKRRTTARPRRKTRRTRRLTPHGDAPDDVLAPLRDFDTPTPFSEDSDLTVRHCGSEPDYLLRTEAACHVASDVHSLTDAVPVGDCDEDDYLAQLSASAPAMVQALYGFSDLLVRQAISVDEFYTALVTDPTAAPRAHYDGGAQGSTTNRRDALSDYVSVPKGGKVFRVADGTLHASVGYGYVKLRAKSGRVLRHRMWYTPTIPATVISPPALGREYCCDGYVSVGMFGSPTKSALRLLHCRSAPRNIDLECELMHGLLFSAPLIMPGSPDDSQESIKLSSECSPESPPVPKSCSGKCSSAGVHACSCSSPSPSEVVSPSDAPPQVEDVPDDESVPFDELSVVSEVPVNEVATPDRGIRCPDCSASIPAGTCGFTIEHSDDDSPPLCRICCPHCSHKFDPPSACEELLALQRFGWLEDVDLPATAAAANGVPPFPPQGHTYTVVGPEGAEQAVLARSTGGGVSPEAARLELLQVLYEDSLVALTEISPDLPESLNSGLCHEHSHTVNHLSVDQKRVLWHQRLGHLSSRYVHDLYKAVDGVPQTRIADDLEKCPVCLQAKLQRANRGKENSRKATVCNQGISIDFGFVVQASNDTDRYKRLVGLHGETCYCLIADHYSQTLYGQCFRSKAPPLGFLRKWLATHSPGPDVKDKYVRMDQGELCCREVFDLFDEYGYDIQITGASSSTMNGAVERAHRTLANGLRSSLAGAKLPPKFWPYCFHHLLRLYNVTVHADQTMTPYQICSGKRPNLSALRTFGCRVYARPAGDQTHHDEAVSNANVGIFLGYHKSLKNILYYDVATEEVKWTTHATFDEGMNDLPMDSRPPNAKLLLEAAGKRPFAPEDEPFEFPDIDFTSSPFADVTDYHVRRGAFKDANLGFEFTMCTYRLRAYISALSPARRRGLSKTKAAMLVGAYVMAINGLPVRTVTEVERLMAAMATEENPPDVTFTLGLERRSAQDKRPPAVSLRLNDLRRVCALQYGTGTTRHEIADDIAALDSELTDADLSALIHGIELDRVDADGCLPPTAEERALSSYTYRRVKRLSTWPLWKKAFKKQLDDLDENSVFGEPISRPPGAYVLRPHWANVIKATGLRKARLCCDGSKRAAPGLRDFMQTYSSCIETPCMRLFYALCAAEGMHITGADCTCAFQQCNAPAFRTYLAIDEIYIEWWNARHPDRPLDPVRDRNKVLPIIKNLQGLPCAGREWEKHITPILEELGLKPTTHERNLYSGTIFGDKVLVCQQVDDFAIGCHDPATADKFIDFIASKGISIRNDGECRRYNGLDVLQTRDYIKISCETYLDKVLTAHGWSAPQAKESDHARVIPISDTKVEELQLMEEGPKVGTPEHKALEKEMGWSYRQVLGECIYAYTICRCDISFAVVFLARYATCPTSKHYTALKHLVKYLRATKDWGIIYWRPRPRDDKPAVPWTPPLLPANESDGNLPAFPSPSSYTELLGLCDASFGSCRKTRRSVTGLVFMVAGGVVYYKSKLQTLVTVSSTEAELVSCVHAGKVAKYLRTVLTELGYPPPGPTEIHCDNEAVINISTHTRPTARTRHVDISFMALSEWCADPNPDLRLVYVNTKINSSDALTKPVAWVLHRRHCHRAMGHMGPLTLRS